MFWSKIEYLLSADKRLGCPKGSICAWEYRGKLYKTKALRDEAELESQNQRRKFEFVCQAAPKIQLAIISESRAKLPSSCCEFFFSEMIALFLFNNQKLLESIGYTLTSTEKEVITK